MRRGPGRLRGTLHHALRHLPELMNVGLGHDHTINEYYQAAAG